MKLTHTLVSCGIKALAILLALVLSGCGVQDAVTNSLSLTGELKVVNNTDQDAVLQRRKCGATDWTSYGTVRAGKAKTSTLDEQCWELRAQDERGSTWFGTAVVQGGYRTTLWIEW